MKETENSKARIKTSDLVMTALFAAITAIFSQIAIPMPSQVAVTLQTFAVALCGYCLGAKRGTASILVYILLGAIGIPVFTGFKGGIACIASFTGGFIYGFLPFAFLCGLPLKNKALKIAMGLAGLLILHFFGTLHYSLLTSNGFTASFLLVSAPYLIKDAVSVVLAFFASAAFSRVSPRFRQ
ncbi:MAG: biotin transporter BioY [Bacteroides sp.]|nr:biotin transporter BioY [Bacteroides sp.]